MKQDLSGLLKQIKENYSVSEDKAFTGDLHVDEKRGFQGHSISDKEPLCYESKSPDYTTYD